MLKIEDVMKHKAQRQAIKGFLIDPKTLQITEFTLPGKSRDNLNAMYKAIGCELVEVVYLNAKRDGVFVDEEGLLKNPTEFFYIEGTHQPLAGRGVVVGCDEEGETVSAQAVTLDWLRANTAFVKHLHPGVLAIASPEKLVEKVEKFFA
jgi:hypothetical protein